MAEYIWVEKVKEQEWYINREVEIANKLDQINTNKYNIPFDVFVVYLENLVKEKGEITKESQRRIRYMADYYRLLKDQYAQIGFFYAGYFGKVDSKLHGELEKDINDIENKRKKAEESYNKCKETINKITNMEDDLNELIFPEETEKYNDDLLGINTNLDLVISNDYKGVTFDTIIDNTNNEVLKRWYEHLKELYENPYRNFFLNENTVCNFKIVFRNPKTGLYTDKEPIVQISHSTSSKKTPVFSMGYNTYKAYSMGVKLLAGTMVTNNFDNIPLPHLHSISYANHISAEDLPPLDLYIIPIKHINPEGKFEIVMIKGIQFIDMKENDNAASTGLYYAFQYFAEDIMVLDYEDVSDFYNINSGNKIDYEIKEVLNGN